MHVNPPTTRLRPRIAVILGLLLALVGAAAASAHSETLPSAGHVSPSGDAGGVRVGDRQTLIIPIGGLTPGDTVRGSHTVVNGDGQSLRYALSSASADDDRKAVRDVLRVTIWTADLESGSAATCERIDGSTLYHGPLGADSAGFGDGQMGNQSGDRLLAPGRHETLCFEIAMPLDLGNEYQGATTSTTWTIVAEQTAGNP